MKFLASFALIFVVFSETQMTLSACSCFYDLSTCSCRCTATNETNPKPSEGTVPNSNCSCKSEGFDSADLSTCNCSCSFTISKLTNATTPVPSNKTTMTPISGTTSRPSDGTTQRITDKTTKPFDGTTQRITDKTTKPFDGTTRSINEATTSKPTGPIDPSILNPYCNISTCSQPKNNTLCLYSNTTWGSFCQPGYPNLSIVSQDDITTILKVHNDFRRFVAQGLEIRGLPGPQPSASNMRLLSWDYELAVMATALVQQCMAQRDICRDVSRFQVGQNMYMFMSSTDSLGKSNWNATITTWYSEVISMTQDYVAKLPLKPAAVINHYTQIVWATTYTVGCGSAYYKSPENTTTPYRRLYVCNYGPTGNVIGNEVYSQGSAGSACPAGTKNSEGLCS